MKMKGDLKQSSTAGAFRLGRVQGRSGANVPEVAV